MGITTMMCRYSTTGSSRILIPALVRRWALILMNEWLWVEQQRSCQDRVEMTWTGRALCPQSMLHTVPFSVPMRLVHGLVLGSFSRVALVSATHFMLGFHCGLLGNVAAQFFA